MKLSGILIQQKLQKQHQKISKDLFVNAVMQIIKLFSLYFDLNSKRLKWDDCFEQRA